MWTEPTKRENRSRSGMKASPCCWCLFIVLSPVLLPCRLAVIQEQMGKCLMSVQIWPVDKAQQQPVGLGRNDPNSNPFLPPPTGRLRFSLNPFVMGTELFGPKICCRIACCCCCILLIVLMVYFSSFFNFLFTVLVSVF